MKNHKYLETSTNNTYRLWTESLFVCILSHLSNEVMHLVELFPLTVVMDTRKYNRDKILE